jgi:hypothetical protein
MEKKTSDLKVTLIYSNKQQLLTARRGREEQDQRQISLRQRQAGTAENGVFIVGKLIQQL